MFEVRKNTIDIFEIISEPGDGTHYHYAVIFQGDEDFIFAPIGNYFNYPQRLSYSNIKAVSDEALFEMAQKMNVNLWTMKECRRTMRKILKGEIK